MLQILIIFGKGGYQNQFGVALGVQVFRAANFVKGPLFEFAHCGYIASVPKCFSMNVLREESVEGVEHSGLC